MSLLYETLCVYVTNSHALYIFCLFGLVFSLLTYCEVSTYKGNTFV